MNTERVAKIIVSIIAMAVVFSAVSLTISSAKLHRIVEETPTYTAEGWRTDEPPMSEPIVGIWTDGGFRSHIVCMVYGAAYPYEPTGIALQAIEYNRPEMWTRLP